MGGRGCPADSPADSPDRSAPACAALAGRHVLPFCLGLIVGFVFSVGLDAAEKISTFQEYN